ncbi:eukaryotic aspartyl protease (macronuclear) [Tetrahymena thermophila SB210]|uniref:Eukaryotic aspartyl protease n=1 Tax=Tetrahymena thermophila (strain SB210) TaxID=312017 RepID=Q22NG4_TETTS|nr:eukaryotic aspartyl protease [Tetrahymena thermophila SB210]EAR86821.2 eukaryotic aspartyl protease [Tetrahymena thermophila SB210]|eukprot:XP_001007066.2 eukaryotic aspartyl protease [Tetrahymena thermophila SB210]
MGITNFSNSVYMLSINVGQSKTQLNVQLDTGSYVLWFVSKSCQGCGDFYPNRYDCIDSDGCTLSTKNNDITFADGTKIQGTVGQVPVYFEDGTLINNQYFLYVTQGQNVAAGKEDGILGLGIVDPYNQQDNAGISKQTINSRLILGVLDQQYIKQNSTINIFPVTSKEHWSITASEVSYGDTVISSSDIKVLIDSGTSYIALPKNMLDAVKKIMSDQYSINYDSKISAFVGECSKRFPAFSFKFEDIYNNMVIYTLEAEYYSLYDSEQNQCGFIIIEIDDDEILLGDVFMMKYVSTFQYSPKLQVQLAQSITQPNQIPFQTHTPSSDNPFPLWAKIIIPIACCLIIAIFGYFIYRCYQKSKLNNALQQQSFQQQLKQEKSFTVNSSIN